MAAPALIAIDTTATRLQLAFLRDERCDTLIEDRARGHAEILFDRLNDLLARNHAGYADLTRIAVTTGPGSFTGLRIGLAAARGLALALDIAAVGIPTLVAHSLGLAGAGTILVPARRKEVYAQTFVGPGEPDGPVALWPETTGFAAAHVAGFVDIAALARFAATADPAAYLPDPLYVRAADAKPQTKAKVARI